MHMPPPVHGAAIIGQQVHDSSLINSTFDCQYVNIATARNLEDIGRWGIRKLVDNIRKWREISQAVRDFHPDLIYVSPNTKGGPFYRDYITIQLLKHLHSNIVIHLHNKGVSQRQQKWLDNKLYRRFFEGLKVILLSERLYDDVKKYVARKDVMVCPNGIADINSNYSMAYYNNTSKNDAPIQMLFLSNMMMEKGVWTLLDALRIVKDNGVPFFCNFVGGWKDVTEQAFANRIDAYGLNSCVKAHGALYGEAKEKYWEKSDVFVFPTLNECFPLVLLEAMSHGKACISTREASIPEIVLDGKTGLLIDKEDYVALAKAIETLAEDRKLCQKMGEAGRAKYEQEYTLPVFERRFVQILNEIFSEINESAKLG